MNVILISNTILLRENYQADLLAGYLCQQGFSCKHFGIEKPSDFSLIKEGAAEVICTFYDWEDSYGWNSLSMEFIKEYKCKAKFIILECNLKLAKLLLAEYPFIDGVIRSDYLAHINNLDTLPFADRSDLTRKNVGHAILSIGRGGILEKGIHQQGGTSQKNAIYTQTKDYRKRSIPNIVSEIKYLMDNNNIHGFMFEDYYMDRDHGCEEYLNELARSLINQGLTILYSGFFSTEVCRLKDETIKNLISSGLYRVNLRFGINGPHSTRAIERWRSYDVETCIKAVNFDPYSTYASLYEKVDFLRETHFADIGVFNVKSTLMTGTDFYEKVKNDGLIIDRLGQSSYLKTGYMFKNPEIHKLSLFLNSLITDEASRGIFNETVEMLYFYHRFALMMGNDGFISSLKGYLEEAKGIQREYSGLNAEALYALVRLAEKGWEDGKASHIVERCITGINDHGLQKRIKKIQRSSCFKIQKESAKNGYTHLF